MTMYNISLSFEINNMFKKTITSDFFTTVSLRQAMQSVYLMTFWCSKLRYWKDVELFEKELLDYVTGGRVRMHSHPTGEQTNKKLLSFYNARSALFHALSCLGLKSDDEVVVSWYTCVSVSNAVLQTGAKIVYSDIESETLGFDYEKLVEQITPNTKVILVQHTFGMQSRDYEKIIELSREKDIVVIEDSAHSLGNGQDIKWDFAIFSTGRDKVISSVTGWFLLVNNEKYTENKYLNSLSERLKMPSMTLAFQNLMYNLIGFKAYALYDVFSVGKITIFLWRKLNLITEILTAKEKDCESSDFYFALPNSLACLARKELEHIDEYIATRKANTETLYQKIQEANASSTEGFSPLNMNWDIKNNYFRVGIILKDWMTREKLYAHMRSHKILLGKTWAGSVISPVGTELKKAWYIVWSCTIAEEVSQKILFLPNHIDVSGEDLERVSESLKEFNVI